MVRGKRSKGTYDKIIDDWYVKWNVPHVGCHHWVVLPARGRYGIAVVVEISKDTLVDTSLCLQGILSGRTSRVGVDADFSWLVTSKWPSAIWERNHVEEFCVHQILWNDICLQKIGILRLISSWPSMTNTLVGDMQQYFRIWLFFWSWDNID